MRSYAEVFEERGTSYDIAMRDHPRARDAEFAQLVEAAEVRPGMRVGDVPAGGGYLRPYLPAGTLWEGHEPCASFTNHGSAAAGNAAPALLPLPWGDGELDVLLSLAGVHHLDDKVPLFAEALRVVKPRGRLVVSDVAESSKVAEFLDGFVGKHNSTGHEGSFLSLRTIAELRQAGWKPKTWGIREFTWSFANRAEMTDFTRHLFDIGPSADDRMIENAIERDLGTIETDGGGIGMNWALMTIVCEHG